MSSKSSDVERKLVVTQPMGRPKPLRRPTIEQACTCVLDADRRRVFTQRTEIGEESRESGTRFMK